MLVLLILAAFTSIVRVYTYEYLSSKFSCRSKMYISDDTELPSCARKSSSDFYFAFKGNSTGYIIITGSATCADEKDLLSTSEIINFTYTKENGFYSLQLGERSKILSRVSRLFKDDVIKLNFTPTSNKNYVVTTPLRPIMLCTIE